MLAGGRTGSLWAHLAGQSEVRRRRKSQWGLFSPLFFFPHSLHLRFINVFRKTLCSPSSCRLPTTLSTPPWGAPRGPFCQPLWPHEAEDRLKMGG